MRVVKSSFLLTLALALTAPLAGAVGNDEPVGTVRYGTPLDPSTYGPSVIESVAEVEAREARGDVSLPAPVPRVGRWRIPTPRATHYANGRHNVVNEWGDTRMAIGFPTAVNLSGAFVAGQAGEGVWARGIRVVGYRAGEEVQATPWFEQIRGGSVWFPMNLSGVDRIVIEARPSDFGGGWYAMDDLTYAPLDANGVPGAKVVVDFEQAEFGQYLTGTSFAGLTWETGTGSVLRGTGNIIPAPLSSPVEPPAASGLAEPMDGLPPIYGGTGNNPSLTNSFQGLLEFESGFAAPADAHMGAGPTQVVNVVNLAVGVYNKTTGVRTNLFGLFSFFPAAISASDPRVLYDQHSGRWIIIMTDPNAGRIHLAVSTTNNAGGTYFKTSFPNGGGGFADYPTLGVDANGIYCAASLTAGSPNAIFVIDKAPLIASSPSLGTVTTFNVTDPFGVATIQPCHTYGTPATPGEYLINRTASNNIRIRRVAGPMTAPVLTTVANLTIATHSVPPDAPAAGSGTPLDTVDERLMNAVFRANAIWTTHCINIGGRAASRWYKINETPGFSVAMTGTVDDPTRHYYFPSIAVNSNGHAVLGCTGSHAGEFASAYFCGRLASDTVGQMGVPVLFRVGFSGMNHIDGLGRNRWGDYSMSVIDPSDELTLWTVQNYAHTGGQWGAYFAKVNFPDVDITPPSPSPMTWSITPQPASTSSIVMQATTATDTQSPPVEYFFDYTGGSPGGHDSGWQSSVDYTDTGLPTANSGYNYVVRARDSATPSQNVTGDSPTVLGSTAIQTPAGISFGTVTDTSIQVTATGTFTNLNLAQSGIFFEMTPNHGSGANVWVQTSTITVTGLNPGTLYTFRVKARNFQGFETPLVGPASQMTPGGSCALPGDMDSNGTVNAADIAGFTRTKLGMPQGGDNAACADYGTGDVLLDTALFVDDVLTTP